MMSLRCLNNKEKELLKFEQQAQYYTEEDWDLIRARMEASTELRKSVFGSDIDAEDYAKKMVELVEKRRREIMRTKQKAKKKLKRSGETLQGAEKKKQKVLDVEDIPIPESAKFVKEEEIEIKQPVLKMSRRKSKARKGIGLHTSTEPESEKVEYDNIKEL
ncbi:hypothetical protein Tco_0492898 [Tanacetum coccineum]